MTSNVAGLIREGVAALKANRKEEALKLLRRATELDERNEEAWLWLSAAVDSLENQQICLENVLAINPNNTRALQGLEMIKRQLARKQQRQTPPPSGPQAVPPFDVAETDLPYVQPPSEPFVAPGGPFAAPADEAAAFHGSGRAAPQPSAEEYDAWVEGLNLGRGSSTAPDEGADAGDVFGFEGGPFQPPELEEEPLGWGADEDLPDVAAYRDMVSPAPDVAEASGRQIDPFALPQTASFGDEAEEFGGAEPDEGAYVYDDFAGAEGAFSSASPFGGFGSDEAVEDANELKQFFAYIPPDIPATYLPGRGPKYPLGLLVGLFAVSGGLVLSVAVMVYLLLFR